MAFGEVYKDVEGAGGALAVARQVAGPGLLDPAAPGGVIAQPYKRVVARVALVELEGQVVGPALGEALHQDGGGTFGLGGILQQHEGPRVVLLRELVERHGAVLDGVLDRAEEDRTSTRLNSSHANISYAVFCLKKLEKHVLAKMVQEIEADHLLVWHAGFLHNYGLWNTRETSAAKCFTKDHTVQSALDAIQIHG